MKLLKIKLQNFQGVKDAEFDFGGKSASIYGDNATGKTTVFNAFTWLLFGNASTGAKGFTPKTEGTHGLDYVSEALIEADDGSQVSLRKVYHEIWKKRRGSTEKEFSGHTTDCFIDGVPVSATQFADRVRSLVGTEEQMRMLTMPDYFPATLAWQKRREILLQVCGNVSDADVISKTAELTGAHFSDMLRVPGDTDRSYTVEEFRKILTENRRKINEELTAVPERIDEAQRAIPETADMTLADADVLRKHAEAELKQAQAEYETDSGNPSAAIYSKISSAQYDFIEAKNQYGIASSKRNEGIRSQVAELRKKEDELHRKEFQLRSDIHNLQINIDDITTRRQKLIEEFQREAAIVWDDTQAVCPTCHRPYEPDQAEQMKADFNRQRSEKLTALNLEGKKYGKDKIAQLQADQDRDSEALAETVKHATEISNQIDDLNGQIQTPPPFETTEEAQAIQKKIDSLKKLAESSDAAAAEAEDEKRQAVAEKQEKLDEIMETIAELKASDRQKKRIEELKDDQKRLAQEFEQTEYKIHLCEVFTKAKVEMLDEKINSRFKTLRFRLFEEQINGGLKDCCEVLIPSADGTMVPYQDANNAAKINAGLEIIHTLSEAWDIRIPVMVDNAEAVTHLTEYPDMQVIRLVVSEKDKKLRMQIDPAA